MLQDIALFVITLGALVFSLSTVSVYNLEQEDKQD